MWGSARAPGHHPRPRLAAREGEGWAGPGNTRGQRDRATCSHVPHGTAVSGSGPQGYGHTPWGRAVPPGASAPWGSGLGLSSQGNPSKKPPAHGIASGDPQLQPGGLGGCPGDKAYMLCGDKKAPIPRLPQNHVGLCSPTQHSHPSLSQTPTGCGVPIAVPEGASPHTVPAGYECPLYLQQCFSALCPSEAQSKLCTTQIQGLSLPAPLLPSPTCCLLLSPSHQALQGWAVIGWALLCWVVPPAWSPRHRGSTEGILLQ